MSEAKQPEVERAEIKQSEVKLEVKKPGMEQAAVKQEVVVQKSRPIKKFFKSFVDVKKWSSYDEVSGNAKTTWSLFRRLLHRNDNVRQETYEEAIDRLGLGQEQLAARKDNFLYSFMIYGFFSFIFFIYFVYLLFNTRLLAAFLVLILMSLMALAAYREHFWYMQMQKKKLGCTFQDWLDFILRR